MTSTSSTPPNPPSNGGGDAAVCLDGGDPFLEELADRGRARWVARLSDGSHVYQDDDRPWVATPAWVRLKNYVESNGLWVTALWPEFRDHRFRHALPDDAAGYVCLRSLMAVFGLDFPAFTFFKLGAVDGDVVRLQTWQTPELILMEEETVPVSQMEFAIIRKPDHARLGEGRG